MHAITRSAMFDIDVLVDIERQCFKAMDCFSRTQFQYYSNKGMCFTLRSAYCHVVGYFIVKQLRYTLRVYSMAVDKACRRGGLATMALDYIEAMARLLNKDHITLEVRRTNLHAKACYKKNGYSPRGIKYNYYNDGMDAIVMQKDIVHATGRLAQDRNII